MANSAVSQGRVATVVGYQLKSADFQETTSNLPQRIVVIGEANEANQSALDVSQVEITSENHAGLTYGFGSPIHMMCRILKPRFGSGVGAIPVIAIAQPKATGATQKEMTITVVGNSTKAVTHTLVVCGREQLDGVRYDFTIASGSTPTQTAAAINDAIAKIVSSPVSSTFAAGVVTAVSKWSGLSADEISITINTNGDDAGVTYTVADTAAGSGTPDIQPALDTFGTQWNTLIVNSYGTVASVVTSLETFNGRPDNTSPTGQFQAIIHKPFVAVTGSTSDNDSVFTETKKDEVTIAVAPAPLSKGISFEAAANMVVLYAPIANSTPHLGVTGLNYPDMPTPEVIGTMSSYTNRDTYVKAGNSTVVLNAGKYQVEDFVTTHHPDDQSVPQHRYVRNRTVDSNFRFGYYLLEQRIVIGKTIAKDDDFVAVSGVVKPKQWKAEVFNYIDDTVARGLITDAPFSKASVVVEISTTNPNRIDTNIKYKRTSIARIGSTVAEAGFNSGEL